MSDDLVTQLKEQAFSDHVRGCEGRQYSCDCGYDIRTEGLLEQAATALSEARAEIDRLREAAKGQLVVINTAIAERERAERNRDMWKDQCKRQAARLELLHAAIRRQVDNIERWRETGKPASPDESKSIYEQLVAALNG